MTRTLAIALTAAGIAAVAGTAAAAGSAAGSTAGPGRASELVLTATFDAAASHTTDVPPHGPSAGDVNVYSATLRSGGRIVGRLEGTTTAADNKYQGDVSVQYYVLNTGTIAVLGGGESGAPGVGRPDDKIFDSIVGGTRRYVGAGGWVSARDLDETTEQVTFHLR